MSETVLCVNRHKALLYSASKFPKYFWQVFHVSHSSGMIRHVAGEDKDSHREMDLLGALTVKLDLGKSFPPESFSLHAPSVLQL